MDDDLRGDDVIYQPSLHPDRVRLLGASVKQQLLRAQPRQLGSLVHLGYLCGSNLQIPPFGFLRMGEGWLGNESIQHLQQFDDDIIHSSQGSGIGRAANLASCSYFCSLWLALARFRNKRMACSPIAVPPAKSMLSPCCCSKGVLPWEPLA